jgi:hypothetical protein
MAWISECNVDALSRSPVTTARTLERVAIGGAAWMALALLALGPARARIGWLELTVLLEVLVVWPLVLVVLNEEAGGRASGLTLRAQPFASASAAASLLVARGTGSALLAMVGAALVAVAAAPGWVFVGRGRGRRGRRHLALAGVAFADLVIGAIALACWRGRVRPLDATDVCVGIAAALLSAAAGALACAAVAGGFARDRARALTFAGGVGIALGVPVALLGLVGVPALGVLAWFVLPASALALGVAFALCAIGIEPSAGRLLLWLSFVSALGVAAAAIWGASVRTPGGAPFASGRVAVANATMAFVVSGLLGWISSVARLRGSRDPL